MFMALAGLASSLIGASSASKAADAQVSAANAQADVQRDIYNTTREDLAPFRDSTAQNALLYEMGLGPAPIIGGQAPDVVSFTENYANPNYQRPQGDPTEFAYAAQSPNSQEMLNRTRFRVGDQIFDDQAAAQAYADANPTGGMEYGGYTKTPGYDFRLNQGLGAVENSAAARGGLNSGATLKALTQYGQDYGSAEYNNYLAQLSGLAANSQNAAGMSATAGQNYAAGMGNVYSSIGNARSAGAIGTSNAIQGGINNLSGIMGYQNAQSGTTGNLATLGQSWGGW